MIEFNPNPEQVLELAPCPFCGRPGRLYQDRFGQFAAECAGSIRFKDCFFSRIHGGGLPKFETAALAVAAWNKREQVQQKPALDLINCPINKE